MVAVSLIAISSIVNAGLISVDDFNQSDLFQYNGTAVIDGNGDVLLGTGGSIYTTEQISLENDASFSTKFSFNFSNRLCYSGSSG
jgi:hypothetical protein